MNIYSIYDEKSKTYSGLYLMTKINAQRFVAQLVATDDTFRRFADDFAFICVGVFNSDQGKITSAAPFDYGNEDVILFTDFLPKE